MSEVQRGSAPFKPRARLLVLLGEQLITNEIIAIVELVKNSYDADATQVDVILNNVTDIEEGQILIKDNGTGMSLDTILNVWLEPGTEYRKTQREKGERTKKFERPFLGEKGVGRFAAHKLGTLVRVITRMEGEPLETLVEVDWTRFEKNVYLDEVPVYWERRNPKVFLGKSHGTQIVIDNLRTAWTDEMALSLAQKLMALQSPFRERMGFSINLETPDFPLLSIKIRPIEEILENPIYSLKGKVNEKGVFIGEYRFQYPALKLKRVSPISEDIKGLGESICGPFDVRFHVWDLDPTTLKETVTTRTYRDYIQPHTGIRLYRDGFRVWPFGEPGDDWLGLDARRVNNPTKCLSNNQIIGIVEISHTKNPQLRDKTDREGLIDNKQFQDFKSLVLSSLNILEIERRKDKNKVDRLHEKKAKRIDITIEAIDNLREKMKKSGHFELYRRDLNDIENAYRNEVISTLEPLIVSAGIGVAYMMPAHELSMTIKDLEEIIHSLNRDLGRIGVGGEIAERLPKMLELTGMMSDVAEGALELSRRKPETFTLRSTVESAVYVKKPELRKENISTEVLEKEKISLKGVKNLILASVLNLIDNSIYWLGKTAGDKKIQIMIARDIDSSPRIVVSDNGPGIRREDLSYLGEAFFTRKTYGTGLGLYITRKAMKANDGELTFGFFGEEPDFLTGANIILRFSPEREVKK